MDNEIPNPPRPEARGCAGKGCLTVLGLATFLVIALIAGTFWGVHYLRGYSAPKPLVLPVAEAEAIATPATEAPPAAQDPAVFPATQAPLPVATPAAAMAQPNSVASDWKAFQQAAKRGEAVLIELTASDINTLIAGSDDAVGKVWTSIENNVGRVQVSLPLKGVPLMEGRYLNGEISVKSSPDGDPAKAEFLNIVLNGEPVSNTFLDRSLFGYPSLRTVVSNWIKEQNIASFRIENNKAIGESGGAR